jgi:gluconate 5-dehydrogenase
MIDIFNLDGKVALITGSSKGLGLAMAEGLAQAGASVVLNARNQGPLDEAVTQLREKWLKAHACAFDVTDPQQLAAGVERIEREIGPIDILVNNAGIQRRHPLEDFPLEVWNEVIELNLTAPFLAAQAVAKGMIARRGGKIINICSLQSELGRPTIGAYTAAKGGLKTLTRAMCVEWAKHDIQINAIGPGYFITEMTQKLVDDEQFNAWICGRTPAGRWGLPRELIGTCVYLASEASSFVNGQIIYVDGGVLASM